MQDLRQSPRYAKYIKSIGWKVEKINGIYTYIRKFPILGNFIKIQRPEFKSGDILNLINRLRIKYRPFQIVFEPKSIKHSTLLGEHGFHQSKTYFVPSKTIHIDLTKSKKQLLKKMHHKTRYNIKKAKSNKLKVTNSKDISQFADFWQSCALKQRGMFINQKKEIIEIYDAFNNKSDILFCRKDKELLAGILILHSNNMSYYMYAASTDKGKKLFAPTFVAWEGIKLSKKSGSKIFDFEGIYDQRFPLKSWKGFSRFKESFGGTIVDYPGTYIKFMFPYKFVWY